MILKKRGINTSRTSVDDMRIVMAHHEDFQNEKTIVKYSLESKVYKNVFSTKFPFQTKSHRKGMGQVKVYTKTHRNFTLQHLHQIINPALNSVSMDLMQKCFQRQVSKGRLRLITLLQCLC